jgi:uncharacterized membrane protein
MQRSIGATGQGDQVIGTEKLAASIAVELVAAGAEHLAGGGIGAGADFEECIAAIFVVFDRKALEKGIASGAGRGCELLSHVDYYN